MEVEWKPIKGYEQYYQVSNYGEIYDNRNKRLMKANSKSIYQKARLRKQKDDHKTFMVHRLVAEAFIPNPDNKPHVHHIDENSRNNKADNLEWVTPKEHAERRSEESKMKYRKTYQENKKKRESLHRSAL